MPENYNFIEHELINQNLFSIVNKIRLLVVGVDKNAKIIFTNPYFLLSTGYRDEELLNNSIEKLLIPFNKKETFDKQLAAVLTNNYSMQTESQIVKKDGSKMFVDWHNFPITSANKLVGMLSVGVDITSHMEIVHLLSLNEKTMRDRADLYEKQNVVLEKLEKELQKEKKSVEKKVEERTGELNQEKARLLASINSFPYGLLVTDNKDNVIISNNRLAAIFGIKQVEWHLSDLKDYLNGSSDFLKYYGLVKTSKQPYLMKDIDLQTKFLEIYISPIFLSPLSNETIGNVVLVSDVTEQKISQRSKDEFFSIASHELRTPLTAIRGNTEMLKKHYASNIKDKIFTEIIDDIKESSERLIGLVNEFLNMSRLEQGKMQFKQEGFDLASLTKDVIDELTTTAVSKGLVLRMEPIKEKLPKAFADSGRTREILVNLISNAINYTDKGECCVKIKVQEDGHIIKVTVTDTGKGIPSQNQNLLFRKFQQANDNIYARDASRSTGLGLYISKLMIEAMHGSIYLERSEVGVGSSFVFTLPIA